MKRVITTLCIIAFTASIVSADRNCYRYRDNRQPERIEQYSGVNVTPPPRADELFSPAEFSRAHGIFLGWNEYEKVVLKDIALEIAKQDTVYVVHMKGQDSTCRSYFAENNVNMDNVKFIDADTNEVSVWIRDYGSFYVYEDGKQAAVQYDYKNYPTNPIPGLLADVWGFTYYHASLRFSGGNFMCDGNGMGFYADVLLEENLLLGQEDSVARNFKQYLGCDSVVCLKSMRRDGTGHIDMFCKLLNDTLILVGEYEKASDAYGQNKMILDQNAKKLSKLKNLDGRPFNVVRIPMPPIYYIGSNPVTASYTNSLIVNNKVLVPVYGDSLAKLDTIALNLYKELMPDYEIIGIYSSEIIKSNGAVHCVTNTHFHENPLMIFHSYFDTAVANEAPVIDFRLNPRFKTMAASVFYKAASENEFTEVEAELENGIFSATLPVMGEDFEYYFKGGATWGGEEITVTLPEDAPTTTFSAVVIPTGINSSLAAKRGITFSQYPNPFKGKTTLTYTVNKNSTVSLVIYNVHGRKVCTLADGFHTEGFYSAVWTGTDTKGKQLSSGIYYSVLRVNGGSQNSITRKNKLYIVR